MVFMEIQQSSAAATNDLSGCAVRMNSAISARQQRLLDSWSKIVTRFLFLLNDNSTIFL